LTAWHNLYEASAINYICIFGYIMRYFIIGFKNSGKTTFGKLLAERLMLEFIDLDEYIENREGKTIPEIYTERGEESFRRLEWKALKEVAVRHDNIVISTGGGAPCHCDNMTLMEKYGDAIYLRVSDRLLITRLSEAAKDRPIVLGKSHRELQEYITDLRNRCEHHYKRARYIVDGDIPDLEAVVTMLNAG
jgi:shikimate kinase